MCRCNVDPGGVAAAAELPEEARSKSFYRPALCLSTSSSSRCSSRRSSCDLEAGVGTGTGMAWDGSSATSMATCAGSPSLPAPTSAISAGGSASKQPGNATGGRLAAVERFFRQAGAALAEEEPADRGSCGSSGGKGPKRASDSRVAAWALVAAERVLPETALAAAATALAALRLRQLLHPKEPPGGLAGAAAAWAASLLFLAGKRPDCPRTQCVSTVPLDVSCHASAFHSHSIAYASCPAESRSPHVISITLTSALLPPLQLALR